MIPRIANFIWLGGNKKPDNFIICYESWQKYLSVSYAWTLNEWTEENLPTKIFPEYYHKAIREKKWAFASDVARVWVLLNYGGVYLDTDMLLYKNINHLLDYEFFSGYEDEENIACGIFGAEKENLILVEIYKWYQSNIEYKAIPLVMTEVINKLKSENRLPSNIYIAPKEIFYSYPKDKPCDPTLWVPSIDALAIHLWDYSWQSDTKKILRNAPGFDVAKNLLKKVGLLDKVKKVIGEI